MSTTPDNMLPMGIAEACVTVGLEIQALPDEQAAHDGRLVQLISDLTDGVDPDLMILALLAAATTMVCAMADVVDRDPADLWADILADRAQRG